MYKKLLYILVAIAFITACQPDSTKDNKTPDTNNDVEIPDDVATDVPLKIDDDALDGIIQNFSNNIEMAALIKDVGTAYSIDYLCPPENFEDLNTDFNKALGLGLLSTDLGYLNIYKKTGAIVDFITVIKRLADDLKVGQFFDFQTLKRLATNNENLDSLMYLSVNSFNQMDMHLREHNRSNLSILIVTGVWLEGLYLACEVHKGSKNAEIAERIGEQKIILNDLLIIIKNYKSDPSFQKLITDLDDLKATFDNVKITYTYMDPETKEVDGRIVIVDRSESKVTISQEQIDEITEKTFKIRNKLINL